MTEPVEQPLQQAREAFGRHAWREAQDGFLKADAVAPLVPEDLERLGEAAALELAVHRQLQTEPGLCLLFDRFDALGARSDRAIFGSLRALRDAHKYDLTYITASRRPMDPHSELAELFYANTFWLGALSESDSRWNVARYAARKGLAWDEAVTERIINISRGYPSLLRAVCEAYAAGATLDSPDLAAHPAVVRRLEAATRTRFSSGSTRRSTRLSRLRPFRFGPRRSRKCTRPRRR